jgi:septin family protein
MTGILKYLLPIIIAIYIISPLDAHPLFLDDLIASGVLFYILYKNAKQKKQKQHYDYYRQSQYSNQSKQEAKTESKGPLTLDEAYRLLGVSPKASWDEISKAYKEKMVKSHPDKVSHLSEELQEKAKELTLKLNDALELIKSHKKN